MNKRSRILNTGLQMLLVASFSVSHIAYGASEVIPTGRNLNFDTVNTSAYKPSSQNISSSGIAISVPGCTGITNKVQRSLGGVLSGNPEDLVGLADSLIDFSSNSVTTADQNVGDSLKKLFTTSKDDAFRENCINGIGYRLAKKQLSDITQKTLNWTSHGYDGDPLFVRDQSSFFKDISNKEVIQASKTYSASNSRNDYPYGKEFARTAISSKKAQNNFEESAKSDLSYYLAPGATPKSFSTDFSQGGWNGWLALTQKPQNNPLGFTMIASQHIANQSAEKIQNQQNELNQNKGFLSEKRCVEYYPATGGGTGTVSTTAGVYGTAKGACKTYETITPGSIIAEQVATVLTSPIRQLELADGVNESLGGVFNSLLNKLGIQGLLGLSGFNSVSNGWKEVGGSGYGSNSFSSLQGSFMTAFGTSSSGQDDAIISVRKGDGWNSDEKPFDLTKDLGNTYLRGVPKRLGTWDAKNNMTTPLAGSGETPRQLVPSTGTKDTFYVVSTAGNTELSEPESCFPISYPNGTISNCWQRGDLVLFDGDQWVSAKFWNGVDEKGGLKDAVTGKRIRIIDKKGVIQIQQDYIRAVKASMKELPPIMPALGELDYCIPGPNPSWYESAILSNEALSAYISGIQFDPNTLDLALPDPKQYASAYYGPTPWKQLNPGKVESFLRFSFANIQKSFGDIFKQYFKEFAFSSIETAFSQAIQETQELLDQQKEATIGSLANQLKTLHDALNSIYGQGGTMTSEFIVNNDKELADLNPNYLPMATTGMSFTKDIRIYDVNIAQANKDY